jgi:hypothetical protein
MKASNLGRPLATARNLNVSNSTVTALPQDSVALRTVIARTARTKMVMMNVRWLWTQLLKGIPLLSNLRLKTMVFMPKDANVRRADVLRSIVNVTRVESHVLIYAHVRVVKTVMRALLRRNS